MTEDCMFCKEGLTTGPDGAVHLAFMGHIERSVACGAAFAAWTDHMASDWQG